ncbi:SMI1/KNR4 family protein [Kitasatospora sp. NBC_01250]|uniref:SMI1/KNR4 family protein n=1 Tax=Kitasatospora sp. NBC_01250 TaxID=2903571 RepID=UPI002E32E60B|nr:SMI1/KNR4 family protein [Kitasatospora sp. NBC_01250]
MSPIPVTQSWQRIEAWLAQHAPSTAALLLPPSAREEIGAAERTLGLRFPPDLVDLLRLCGGSAEGPFDFGLGGPYRLHTVAEMTEKQLTMTEVVGAVGEEVMDGSYWHRQFLPIGNWTGTYLLVLDCRPGPGYGRVGRLAEGSGTSFGIWDSLADLLAAQAEALANLTALDHWAPVAFDGRLSWGIVTNQHPAPRSLFRLAAAAEQPAEPAPPPWRYVPVPEAGWVGDHPGFRLTFVAGVSGPELLRRYGAEDDVAVPRRRQEADDAARRWTSGYLPVVRTGMAGDWAFGFETGSGEADRPEVLRRLSAGTRAVRVGHDRDATTLAVLADGELVASYDTRRPERREGRGPGLPAAALRRAGLLPLDTERYPDQDVAAVLDLLAAEFGIAMDAALLDQPLLSAHVLPVLADQPHTRGGEFTSSHEPVIGGALAFAAEGPLRAAVLEQAGLLAAEVGLDDCPPIAEALATAAAGKFAPATDENALGKLLRTLAAEARAAAESRSDPVARDLLTEDERRAWQVRHGAALAIALATGTPVRSAAPVVLSGRLDPHWRTGFMATLGEEAVPVDAVERLAQREAAVAAEQQARWAAGGAWPVLPPPATRPSRPGPQRGLGRGLGPVTLPSGGPVRGHGSPLVVPAGTVTAMSLDGLPAGPPEPGDGTPASAG